jgi:hypothetical protein
MQTRHYTKPCQFKGCYANAKAHGLCTGHLDQRARGKELTPQGVAESTSPLATAVPIGSRCGMPGVAGSSANTQRSLSGPPYWSRVPGVRTQQGHAV